MMRIKTKDFDATFREFTPMAPTICYETIKELTQQRIKQLNTRLKD